LAAITRSKDMPLAFSLVHAVADVDQHLIVGDQIRSPTNRSVTGNNDGFGVAQIEVAPGSHKHSVDTTANDVVDGGIVAPALRASYLPSGGDKDSTKAP